MLNVIITLIIIQTTENAYWNLHTDNNHISLYSSQKVLTVCWFLVLEYKCVLLPLMLLPMMAEYTVVLDQYGQCPTSFGIKADSSP